MGTVDITVSIADDWTYLGNTTYIYGDITDSVHGTAVLGNDSIINYAGSNGNFELNTYRPIIASSIHESITLLSEVAESFTLNALDGLKANEKKLAIRKALRYFPSSFHSELSKEFLIELEEYGRIYMYRFMPNYKIQACSIN